MLILWVRIFIVDKKKKKGFFFILILISKEKNVFVFITLGFLHICGRNSNILSYKI